MKFLSSYNNVLKFSIVKQCLLFIFYKPFLCSL
nr:MAG TPA: hypothetical protein [Caudoviricetes sp.]